MYMYRDMCVYGLCIGIGMSMIGICMLISICIGMGICTSMGIGMYIGMV